MTRLIFDGGNCQMGGDLLTPIKKGRWTGGMGPGGQGGPGRRRGGRRGPAPSCRAATRSRPASACGGAAGPHRPHPRASSSLGGVRAVRGRSGCPCKFTPRGESHCLIVHEEGGKTIDLHKPKEFCVATLGGSKKCTADKSCIVNTTSSMEFSFSELSYPSSTLEWDRTPFVPIRNR